jgi:ABC-type nitrate/sulfonate/bicarbonate transport system substrate-binding protein
MRVTVSDVVSPSYFVATAAVELGYFKSEGLDAEFVQTPAEASQSLRDGGVDFVGGSAYTGLRAFPGWRGGKLLCALSHYTYWFLAIRADIPAQQGDIDAVKGLRISASRGPGLALQKVLEDGGIDLERDKVQIVDTGHAPDGNWAWDGIRAIESGQADAYWGNGMRADLGIKRGVAKLLLDIRRGDGPPIARTYTFPALVTTDRLIETQPEAAAGAVRAIVKTQRALRSDPSLATQVARRLFPPTETELIAGQIARDAEFYDPAITESMIEGASRFARRVDMLDAPVTFEQVVALQFRDLWQG